MTYLKPFEELTFADDFMFGVVMKDKDICKRVLELLLGIKIDHIEYPEPQKIIAPYYNAKGVRLDVYATDGGRVYDVEIQNYAQTDLGKRTRYYQAMIDIDNLLKGQDYSELKESVIIFLCRFDPFKKSIPCYTFSRTCREDNGARLGDESVLKIFNCEAYASVEDEEVQAFLRFLETDDAESDFTRRIRNMIEAHKEKEEMRSSYMSWGLFERDARMRGRKEGKIEGKIEGIAEGEANKAVSTAKNFLAMKLGTHEQIAQAVGLPVEKIEELAREVAQQE